MHRTAAIIAGLGGILASTGVHADDDPRDLFGLGRPKAAEPAATCEEPHAFGCAQVTDPLDDASPYGLTTWLSAAYLQRLPVGNTTIEGVAHYALGASRDEAGPVFGGASGLENRWTIEGAPVDSIRAGASDIRLPLTFVEGITVQAGGWTARQRTSTGGTIDATLVRGGSTHELRTAVYGGYTSPTPERPLADGLYYTRRLATDIGPELSASVVATGPLGSVLGGTAWYAAGVAPTAGAFDWEWTASRLLDVDGDGAPDGYPRVDLQGIAYDERRTYDWLVPVLARVGFDRGPHAIDLTLVGHASQTTRHLGNASIQAAGIDRTDYVGAGIATWRGTWKTTRALVQLAWHRSDRDDAAHDGAAANIPQKLTAYIPEMLPDDPNVAMYCNDLSTTTIPQCPVPFGYYASGGAGLLVRSVGDRPTATAEIAHRTGRHTLRAGATLEDARLVLTSRYTGGELHRSLFDGHEDIARFYRGDCDETPLGECNVVGASELRYRTRYTAAYVEDTWSPEESIRVDGGLRWELMWVGPQLHFSNQLAPRGGISWDFLGKGRSRAWVSGGRSYAYLPTGLGTSIIARDQIVHDITTGLGGHARDLEQGGIYGVPRSTQSIAQDELTAGVEVGLAKAFRVAAWIQGRYLRRGLETSPRGFTNPGRVDGLPAVRATEQLGIEVATEPTAQLAVRVGYLAGRTVGNFTGPWDPQQGSILYDSEELDAGFTSVTATGRLPTDVGHRVYIEAARRGTVGPVELHVATRLSLATGRPRNAFADTDVGWISLIDRGSVGRAPTLTQTNLRVGARWRGFDLNLDVFNVFDREDPTSLDDLYSEDLVRPIDGGSYEDLVFLKDTTERPAQRRTGYGLPFALQSPLSVMLGIHRAF